MAVRRLPAAVGSDGLCRLPNAIAIGFLPPAARPAFFAAYGSIDEDTLLLARLRALFHGVAITYYGHDVGDAALLREGLIAIDHVLSGE